MADSDFIATISAKGSNYTAWESVMVRRDFGNGVSVFEFTPVEGSYGPNNSSLKLQPGDAVTISLGGVKVIDGYVTTRSVSYDERSHQIVVAGKSKTTDVKDSSVVIKPGNYNGSTFEQVARAVLRPHPVQLVMQNAPDIASKPFKTLAVQYGETCGELIARMASMRGLIISDDEDGNVVAGQGNPSAGPVAELFEGRNILRAVGRLDDQTSWGKFAGSSQQPGDDNNWPPRANAASVTNPNARANRVKLFITEHPGDADDVAQRVSHEQTRSMWPVVQCTITVPGWLRSDGALWKPTENVSVYSPMIFPTQSGLITLGIQSCTYAQDSQNGTTTTLDLVLPNLLSSIPTNGVTDLGGSDPSAAKPDPVDTSTNT